MTRHPRTMTTENHTIVFCWCVFIAFFTSSSLNNPGMGNCDCRSRDPAVICAESPSVREENDTPLFKAFLIDLFSNLASNHGANLDRRNPISDCISMLFGNTQDGDPPSIGNRAYSANDPLRITFLVTRRMRLIPSSARSMKFRTIASKEICIASGYIKLRVCGSVQVIMPYRSPLMYMFGPVDSSEKPVMSPHGCVYQVNTLGWAVSLGVPAYRRQSGTRPTWSHAAE